MKPRVGVYGFTGCSGCQLEILVHNEDHLLDIVQRVQLVHFPLTQEKSDEERLDITIVEGSISTERQVEEIKRIRQRSKVLIAVGACATHGGINAIRNPQSMRAVERVVYGGPCPRPSINASGIDKHVLVDYYLRGCPPVKEEFVRVLGQALIDVKPTQYRLPVCVECRAAQRPCLLKQGILCLGPITYGGCGAICTGHKLACDGCRGISDDANIAALKEAIDVNKITATLQKLAQLYNTVSP